MVVDWSGALGRKMGALGRCLAGADVFPSALAGRGSDACGLASRGRGRKCPVKVLRRLHKPKWHATKGSTGPRANCKTQETIRTSLSGSPPKLRVSTKLRVSPKFRVYTKLRVPTKLRACTKLRISTKLRVSTELRKSIGEPPI